jgi:hypothetical protein
MIPEINTLTSTLKHAAHYPRISTRAKRHTRLIIAISPRNLAECPPCVPVVLEKVFLNTEQWLMIRHPPGETGGRRHEISTGIYHYFLFGETESPTECVFFLLDTAFLGRRYVWTAEGLVDVNITTVLGDAWRRLLRRMSYCGCSKVVSPYLRHHEGFRGISGH